MRRLLAGLRGARTRPATGVLFVAGVLLLAACGPAEEDAAFEAPAPVVTTTTATPSPTPPPTTAAVRPTASPTPSPTPVRIAVPTVAGATSASARSRLRAAGLRVRTVLRRTGAAPAGTVLAVSPTAGSRLAPGTTVTLTVAQAPPPPPPPPAPEPEPEPEEDASSGCHPSYSGCLDPDASDYDCAGGSGNGPLYTGRVTVVGPDVFDLDRDGDGIGCERD